MKTSKPKKDEKKNDSSMIYCDAEVAFIAAKKEGEDSGLPRFTMVANTGEPMRIGWYEHPVVIDFSGMTIPDRPIPVRANHDSRMGVGHTTDVKVVNGKTLTAEGVISRDTEAAREIVTSGVNGFPWQASVGVSIQAMDNIESEKGCNVNGRRMKGPMHIVRKSTLDEISFVDLGADHRTSAKVVASNEEGETMEPELNDVELEADGDVDPVATSPAKVKAKKSKDVPKIEASATPASAPVVRDESDPIKAEREKALASMRLDVSAEMKRVDGIKALCSNSALFPIAEKAILEGWDLQKTELEVLRAERPKLVTALHHREEPVSGKVLEAACLITAKVPGVEKQFDEKTLDLVDRRFHGSIGLQEMLLEAAWANGYTGRSFKTDVREAMKYAFSRGHIAAAGLSTIDISGILSNIANKFLLEGFFSVEKVWREITSIRNVNDFKTVTSYRLVGTDQYEKIAPGGEFKHGTLGEQTFTNKAETYGLMLSIDRRDIINDDLGAITTVPRKLGRGSGLKINDVFWTVFLAEAAGTFFTSGNKNYITGASPVSTLGIDGLTLGELTFMNQTDPDGKPIGVMPKVLLVPTALSAIAAQLFKSLEMRDTTASIKFPVANPHAGKFPVLVSRYLGNSAYTGYSTTGWYLLADPSDLPVIETAFLNGNESPTIESSEADFNTLGIQMRGFHDFGVALQDPRGGMKSKGAA